MSRRRFTSAAFTTLRAVAVTLGYGSTKTRSVIRYAGIFRFGVKVLGSHRSYGVLGFWLYLNRVSRLLPVLGHLFEAMRHEEQPRREYHDYGKPPAGLHEP